jgi:hypothetical protein
MKHPSGSATGKVRREFRESNFDGADLRSEPAPYCLHQQEHSDACQSEVKVPKKNLSAKAMIDRSAKEHAEYRERQGEQIIVGYGGSPESRQPITTHANDAGRQEISLQRRPEMLR